MPRLEGPVLENSGDNDLPSLQRSITEMSRAQEEQLYLLQDVLKDLKALEQLALLAPMQKCLLIIENKVQGLSHAPVVEQNANALASPMDIHDHDLGRQSEPDDFEPDAEEKSTGTTISDEGISKDETRKSRGSIAEFYDDKGIPTARSERSMHLEISDKFKIRKTLEGGTFNESAQEKLVNKVEAWLRLWNNIEIPKYENCFYRLAKSKFFQPVCFLVIALNSILIAITADWQIQNLGQKQPPILEWSEASFTIFFLAELIVRLLASRLYFFINNDMLWNIFDLILVTVSVVDFIFEHFVGAQAAGNLSFMRMLRLCKVARIFRSVRTLNFVKALTVMLASLKTAFMSLFWGLVLLIFVLYLYALIYLQTLVDYINYGDGADADLLQLLDTRFSSFYDVAVSLYMSVSGGEDWGLYYDIMMRAGRGYGYLYLAFTFFFFFALLNIITALVVEKALAMKF